MGSLSMRQCTARTHIHMAGSPAHLGLKVHWAILAREALLRQPCGGGGTAAFQRRSFLRCCSAAAQRPLRLRCARFDSLCRARHTWLLTAPVLHPALSRAQKEDAAKESLKRTFVTLDKVFAGAGRPPLCLALPPL